MYIKKVFNSNIEKIANRNHEIFIVVSIGNKYLIQNLEKYVEWASAHTRRNVLCVVADAIHAINYEILNGLKSQRAGRRAQRDGDKVIKLFQGIVDTLPTKKKFDIIRWNDFAQTQGYMQDVVFLKDYYRANADFKTWILQAMRRNLGNDRLSGLSNIHIDKLASYLLNELPALLKGITYDGIKYDLNIYPGPSIGPYMNDLILGNVFPEIREHIIPDQNMTLVEVYVEEDL